MARIMPSFGTISELYYDIIAFQEFYGLHFIPFDQVGMQKQMDEMIQEITT